MEEPIDFVYHLASPASPIDYLRLPLHTLKVGSHGTHHTLGVAKHQRARFLLASTSEVTATRSSTPSASPTGVTSIRSAPAGSTTRPSATPRR